MHAQRINCMSVLKQARLLKASMTHHMTPTLLFAADTVYR
jgi:hypothetical protein